MKKEMELEAGVIVTLPEITKDIPGALKSAGEILHRVLMGTAFVPVNANPAKTENTENRPVETGIANGETAGEISAFPTVHSPIPGIVRGEVVPLNGAFAGEMSLSEENQVNQAFSLAMEDQTQAVNAGMEATLAIQQEILRAILGIRIGDETIARANARYARKMAIAEGGGL